MNASPSPANATPSPAANASPSPSPSATPAATGEVKIITEPVDGDILIDRVVVGNGFYVNASFPAGLYRLSYGAVAGYRKPDDTSLEVTAGAKVNKRGVYTAEQTGVARLRVTQEVAKTSAAVDEAVDIILKVTNEGDGRALNVSFTAAFPDCLKLQTGEPAFKGDLDAQELKRVVYTVKPVKLGLCLVDPTKVVYFSEAGKRFTATSNDINVVVTAKQEATPRLTLRKEISKADPFVGDEVSVTLTIKNEGNAPAPMVNVTDTLPPGCASLRSGPTAWSGSLDQDREKVLSYTIAVTQEGPCTLPSARATYQDERKSLYTKESNEKALAAKARGFVDQYKDLVSVFAVTGGAIGAIVTIINISRKAKGKVSEKKKKE